MSTTHPRTAEEWAAFLETDPMTLPERLRFVAAVDQEAHAMDPDSYVGGALRFIIPGDGQATPAMLHAVAMATGRPRIRQGINSVTNTAPAARAALRRWAAVD